MSFIKQFFRENVNAGPLFVLVGALGYMEAMLHFPHESKGLVFPSTAKLEDQEKKKIMQNMEESNLEPSDLHQMFIWKRTYPDYLGTKVSSSIVFPNLFFINPTIPIYTFTSSPIIEQKYKNETLSSLTITKRNQILQDTGILLFLPKEINVMNNILFSQMTVNSHSLVSQWNFISASTAGVMAVIMRRVFPKPFLRFPHLISLTCLGAVIMQIPSTHIFLMKFCYPSWAKTKEDAEAALSAIDARIEHNKIRYTKGKPLEKVLIRPNGNDLSEFPLLSMKKKFLEEQLKNEIWGEKAKALHWKVKTQKNKEN